MKESTKNGYVAGGVVFFVGLIFDYVWFSSGMSDGVVGIIGLVLSLLGIGGLCKPDFIGEILAHWLNGKHLNRINQHQKRPVNSPQTGKINGNMYINYNHSSSTNRRRVRDFDLLKYIYDNRKRPFTSRELAKVAKKDLEETNESLRYFQEKGWVSLGDTNEETSYAIILKAEGIDLIEDY